MKNKLLITLLSLTCIASNLRAQDPRFPNRGCWTMDEDAIFRAAHPEAGTIEDFENWLQTKIVESKQNNVASKIKTVYTLPIIVHIIHTGQAVGTGYNISDAQINSQIDVLNEDYRKLNADTSSIPLVFKPAAADCQINFCMAKVDPNGIPLATPGIDRINASTKGWTMTNLTNTYITNTIKPASIWNTNKYLNVWVVPDYTSSTGSALLGYATFPAGSTLSGITGSTGTSTTDGFVCWYKSFGRVGNLDATYDQGETATHEIGHWLGLRHIWGDANCGNDYCNDTPPSQTSNFGCSTHPFHVGTCTGNTTGEMFMNYMDYSDDACLYMFTNDQKTRIQTVMSNSPMRIALANSTACNPVMTAGADAAPALITSPIASSCANSFVPSFSLINYGNAPLTSCNINCILDGVALGSQPWTGNIASPGVTVVQLAAISGNPAFSVGAHTLKIYTSNPNGVTDANIVNDTAKITFNITNPTATAVTSSAPFVQPFTTANFTAANYPGWGLINANNGTPTWTYATGVGGFGNSTSCLKMANFSTTNPNPNAGQIDDFTTPNFDFTANNSYYLNFNVAYAKKSSAIIDSLIIYASTDCEATWTKIYGKTGTPLATNGGTSATAAFTPTATQWRAESVNLSTYQGYAHVKFKFRNKNGGGNNLYIDDINIGDLPLSVNSVASASPIVSVYPNPSNGHFSLMTAFQKPTDFKVSVIDVLGNIVFTSQKSGWKEEEFSMDLSSYAKGIYFVEVKTANETITKRISIID